MEITVYSSGGKSELRQILNYSHEESNRNIKFHSEYFLFPSSILKHKDEYIQNHNFFVFIIFWLRVQIVKLLVKHGGPR
jgi:hypothetical protein